MEFNRFTLTGEWDAFYTALLKMSLMNGGLDPDRDQPTHLKAHMERGVALLHNRVRDLTDLQTL